MANIESNFTGYIEIDGVIVYEQIKGKMSAINIGGKNGWKGEFQVIHPKKDIETIGDAILKISDGSSFEVHLDMIHAPNRITFKSISLRCETK